MPFSVNYELIRSDRKSVSISVGDGGKVTVRAPKYMSRFEIDRFIDANRAWIERTVREKARQEMRFPPVRGIDGEKLLYIGRRITLCTGKVKKTVFEGDVLYIPGKEPLKEIEKWYRERAKEILSDLTAGYAAALGFTYKSVKITGARGRFGSCSGKDSINYSFRLIMYPADCIKYVVVHELCHTVHHDHSAAFWREVKRAVPDSGRIREYMKENAQIMNLL